VVIRASDRKGDRKRVNHSTNHLLSSDIGEKEKEGALETSDDASNAAKKKPSQSLDHNTLKPNSRVKLICVNHEDAEA